MESNTRSRNLRSPLDILVEVALRDMEVVTGAAAVRSNADSAQVTQAGEIREAGQENNPTEPAAPLEWEESGNPDQTPDLAAEPVEPTNLTDTPEPMETVEVMAFSEYGEQVLEEIEPNVFQIVFQAPEQMELAESMEVAHTIPTSDSLTEQGGLVRDVGRVEPAEPADPTGRAEATCPAEPTPLTNPVKSTTPTQTVQVIGSFGDMGQPSEQGGPNEICYIIQIPQPWENVMETTEIIAEPQGPAYHRKQVDPEGPADETTFPGTPTAPANAVKMAGPVESRSQMGLAQPFGPTHDPKPTECEVPQGHSRAPELKRQSISLEPTPAQLTPPPIVIDASQLARPKVAAVRPEIAHPRRQAEYPGTSKARAQAKPMGYAIPSKPTMPTKPVQQNPSVNIMGPPLSADLPVLSNRLKKRKSDTPVGPEKAMTPSTSRGTIGTMKEPDVTGPKPMMTQPKLVLQAKSYDNWLSLTRSSILDGMHPAFQMLTQHSLLDGKKTDKAPHPMPPSYFRNSVRQHCISHPGAYSNMGTAEVDDLLCQASQIMPNMQPSSRRSRKNKFSGGFP